MQEEVGGGGGEMDVGRASLHEVDGRCRRSPAAGRGALCRIAVSRRGRSFVFGSTDRLTENRCKSFRFEVSVAKVHSRSRFSGDRVSVAKVHRLLYCSFAASIGNWFGNKCHVHERGVDDVVLFMA